MRSGDDFGWRAVGVRLPLRPAAFGGGGVRHRARGAARAQSGALHAPNPNRTRTQRDAQPAAISK
eukprot:6179030-Pleurochrysis_carterae.AAC.2